MNRRQTTVELFWMDRAGKPKSYGAIKPGKNKRQQTRPGAVWQIRDADSQQPLGHFTVGDRKSKAVVPKK